MKTAGPLTHITVSAPPGRRTPLHPSDGCEPGGGMMYVEAGIVARVRWSQGVRRSIRCGDLFPCNTDGKAVASAELAAAPAPLDGGKIVLPGDKR